MNKFFIKMILNTKDRIPLEKVLKDKIRFFYLEILERIFVGDDE